MNDDEFKQMVAYFWTEKSDPTRLSGWDADRCRRLMPDFFHAWTMSLIYTRLANDAIERESRDEVTP